MNLSKVFQLLKQKGTKLTQALNKDFKAIIQSRYSDFDYEQKESTGLGRLERSMGIIQTYLKDLSYICDIGYKEIYELLNEIDVLYEGQVLSESLQRDYIKILEYIIGIYSDSSDMGEDNKYNECRPKEVELVRFIAALGLKMDTTNEIILMNSFLMK